MTECIAEAISKCTIDKRFLFLSAHKTKKVFEFLEANPTVRIYYTPTYSSWLNQVEIWFSKIQRNVISRGVFTSVKDLARKLMRCYMSLRLGALGEILGYRGICY